MISLTPLASSALVELRAGYGVASFDEDSYFLGELKQAKGFNVDAIVSPPLFGGLGFGLRYETMAFDHSVLGATTEYDLSRVAAVINYRIIDTFMHFGIIGTYGLDEEIDTGATTMDADGATFSLGAEALVSLGLLMVGAEVGKTFGEYEHPVQPNIEVDGLYAKILVGIGF